MASERSVLVVDPDVLSRLGLHVALERAPDLVPFSDTDDLEQGIAALRRGECAAAVIDAGNGWGLDLIARIREERPDLALAAFADADEPFAAERAASAGVLGFADKREASETVLDAIRSAFAGELFVSPVLAPCLGALIRAAARRHAAGHDLPLTRREGEVLAALGDGLGPLEIARTLGLSVKTVETYRTQIRSKLGLTGARQLARYAVQHRRHAVRHSAPRSGRSSPRSPVRDTTNGIG